MMTATDWKRVICAGDCIECPACGEPVCPVCAVHYVDCECPGPTMDDVEYKRIKGVLHGRMREEA